MNGREGVIVSINVSLGGVPKRPVASAKVGPAGIEGDKQRDLRHHGGADRAVCIYSMDLIEALQREGHGIVPGATGENLTIRGLDWGALVPGAQLRTAGVTMELTGYASPCHNIRPAFSDENSNRISQKLHPGWSRVYARVIGDGELRIGDAITLTDRM